MADQSSGNRENNSNSMKEDSPGQVPAEKPTEHFHSNKDERSMEPSLSIPPPAPEPAATDAGAKTGEKMAVTSHEQNKQNERTFNEPQTSQIEDDTDKVEPKSNNEKGYQQKPGLYRAEREKLGERSVKEDSAGENSSEDDNENDIEDTASTASSTEHSHKPPTGDQGVESPIIERSAGSGYPNMAYASDYNNNNVNPQGTASLRRTYRTHAKYEELRSTGPGPQPLVDRGFPPFPEAPHVLMEPRYNSYQRQIEGNSRTIGLLEPHNSPPQLIPIGTNPIIPQGAPGYNIDANRMYLDPWRQVSIPSLALQPRYNEDDRHSAGNIGARTPTTVVPRPSKVEKTTTRRRKGHPKNKMGTPQGIVPSLEEREVQREEPSREGSQFEVINQARPSSSFTATPPLHLSQRAEPWSPGNSDRFDKLIGTAYSEGAAVAAAAAAAAAAAGAAEVNPAIINKDQESQFSPEQQNQVFASRPVPLSEGALHRATMERAPHFGYQNPIRANQDPYAPRLWPSSYETGAYPHSAPKPLYGGAPRIPVSQFEPHLTTDNRNRSIGPRLQSQQSPHPEFYQQLVGREESTQAILEIEGNLRDITKNWTIQETKNGRRLVRFHRSQHGVVVYLGFEPVDPADYRDDMTVVSCIWRRETQEYFVTSVDCISLLELIINQKFTVEEKNRIRRNLEVCKPLTVTKSKPELERFFRQIMSFTRPRPRNIEKDVKVFLWSNLEGALKKIVSKYSASWTSSWTSHG